MAYRGNGKRKLYVSDQESSSNDSDMDYFTNSNHNRIYSKENNSSALKYSLDGTDNSKAKCNTRNAVMARRNRIKKKMYMQKLENEISQLKLKKSKLSLIVANQSHVISDLQKELKYVKSLLINSPDICNLIKNIRDSTGMSVKTCLDKTLNNDCVSKHIANNELRHPWEDKNDVTSNLNSSLEEFPKSESTDDILSNLNDFPLELDLPPLNLAFDGLDEIVPLEEENNLQENSNQSCSNSLNEHNYFTSIMNDLEDSDDVGVCLHVSKHKVSLEFCSSCSENAIETWKENN